MKDNKFVQAAIVGIIALATTSQALASHKEPAAGKDKVVTEEKCYGIVKKGMNDCPTHTTACAGTSTKDGQKDAYILLPKGTCNKIVGGSLEMK